MNTWLWVHFNWRCLTPFLTFLWSSSLSLYFINKYCQCVKYLDLYVRVLLMSFFRSWSARRSANFRGLLANTSTSKWNRYWAVNFAISQQKIKIITLRKVLIIPVTICNVINLDCISFSVSGTQWAKEMDCQRGDFKGAKSKAFPYQHTHTLSLIYDNSGAGVAVGVSNSKTCSTRL